MDYFIPQSYELERYKINELIKRYNIEIPQSLEWIRKEKLTPTQIRWVLDWLEFKRAHPDRFYRYLLAYSTTPSFYRMSPPLVNLGEIIVEFTNFYISLAHYWNLSLPQEPIQIAKGFRTLYILTECTTPSEFLMMRPLLTSILDWFMRKKGKVPHPLQVANLIIKKQFDITEPYPIGFNIYGETVYSNFTRKVK